LSASWTGHHPFQHGEITFDPAEFTGQSFRRVINADNDLVDCHDPAIV